MELTDQEKGLGVKIVNCDFCKSDYKNTDSELAQSHALGFCTIEKSDNSHEKDKIEKLHAEIECLSINLEDERKRRAYLELILQKIIE